jgi:hypothetical protein
MRIAMSSAYPGIYVTFILIESSYESSTTRLHIRDKRTSPCGQSLVTDPFRFSPMSVAVIFLPPKPMFFGSLCYDAKSGAIKSSLDI